MTTSCHPQSSWSGPASRALNPCGDGGVVVGLDEVTVWVRQHNLRIFLSLGTLASEPERAFLLRAAGEAQAALEGQGDSLSALATRAALEGLPRHLVFAAPVVPSRAPHCRSLPPEEPLPVLGPELALFPFSAVCEVFHA